MLELTYGPESIHAITVISGGLTKGGWTLWVLPAQLVQSVPLQLFVSQSTCFYLVK